MVDRVMMELVALRKSLFSLHHTKMGSDTVPLPMHDGCERVLSDLSDKESMFIRHRGM